MSDALRLSRRSTIMGLVGVAGAGGAIGLSQGRKEASATLKVSPAQPVRVETGATDFSRVSLAQVPIGGGGFVTGIEVSADGSRYACRTDVANAYVRDASDSFWRPLFSPSSLEAKDHDPLPPWGDTIDSYGVAGIRLAPSNKDVVVATFVGSVWRSTDGGRTIRRTSLPPKRFFANSGWQRLFNPTIDIHPANPAEFLVGTWDDGVWFTPDGGASWKAVGVPKSGASHEGHPGVYLVLYDPAEPARVYIFVTGVGLFRSTSGPGGKFEALPGGPAHCSNLVAGAGGTLFLCEHTKPVEGGQVWRYSPATGWSSSRPDREALVLAIDPRKPTRALLSHAYGVIMKSEDGCVTFQNLGQGSWAEGGGEVEWTGELTSLFPAQMRFDPRAENRVLIAQGVGVARTQFSASKPIFEDWSAGIEELCAMSVLCVPGGKTFMSAWDKPFWRLDSTAAYTNRFRYPVTKGQRHTTDLVAFSSYLDFAPEDPRFVVGVAAPSDLSAPGFTADGGDTWQAFEGTPQSGWGHGGCIAAASRANFVLLPSNNGTGVFTLDGGKSWSPIKLDGSTPTSHFANAYYVARKNVTADKSRPGTFALVYTTIKGDDYGNPLAGLWVTRDGGRTWAQHLAGVIGSGLRDARTVANSGQEARQFWQCQLDYVPGRPGEMVYTPHADRTADRFFWSQDDGRNWAELHKDIRNVRAFGFGKAAPGQTRPVLFFWGDVRGRRGLYGSLNWLATAPRLISRFPSQMLSDVSCVAGDPDRFGRVFVGTSCAGWVRVDLEG